MGDSLERELSCAVCMELYTDPLLLPCAHSFCRSCLPDVLKRNSNQKSGHSRLVCPSCRFTVELDKRGIDGLPRNFLLDNIIERYKEEKSTDGRPVKVKGVACDVCADSGGAKASKTCIQCGVSYCDRCLRTYHPSKGVFSKHKLVKATRNPKRKDVYCPEHDDELIKMYCVQCKTPVCYLCDRFGGHKGHQVAELKTSYKLMKETLSSNLAQLVSKMANVNEFIITLERKGESIQTNAAVMHQRISEEFAVIKAMLEQRERVMHTKISEETARKLLLLKQQNMACQDKLHNTAGLIQYTREVLKEEVPAALLLTGASLDDRLNCAIDSCPQLQPNTADDFSHVILNLEYEKQIIQKMDLLTIKAPEKPRMGGHIEVRNTVHLSIKHAPCIVDSYDMGVCRSGGLWDYFKIECGKGDERETDEYRLVKEDLAFDSEYFFKARVRNKAGASGWSNVFPARTGPQAMTFRLDPETAHEDLVIISAGRSVIYQPRPRGFWVMQEEGKASTGRFHGRALSVLADVVLATGVHYWEVTTQVAEKQHGESLSHYTDRDASVYRGDIAIGLAKQNCNRDLCLGSDGSSWALRLPSNGGNWYVAHKNKQHVISAASAIDSCPRSQFPAGLHVGILVDFTHHKLRFYDCNRKILLYSCDQISKEKRLCPALEISDSSYQLNLRTGTGIPDYANSK